MKNNKFEMFLMLCLIAFVIFVFFDENKYTNSKESVVFCSPEGDLSKFYVSFDIKNEE